MKTITALFIFMLLTCSYAFSQTGDTITTGSGLKYIVIQSGTGARAMNGSSVEVHYTGMLADGSVFQTSRGGDPIDFILGNGMVIQGWEEGIGLMSVGDQYRLIIPSNLAYGSKGSGSMIPPDAALIFDVELMSVGIAKKSLSDELLGIIFEKGIDAGVKRYKEIKKSYSNDYNMKEAQLNTLGYTLLQGKRIKDGIEILKLNVAAFPKSANVYDSLGEAYMMDGDKDQAIFNYKKSLAMDPRNDNAKAMLEKLGEKP